MNHKRCPARPRDCVRVAFFDSFVNEYGERFTVTIERDTKLGVVTGREIGDVGIEDDRLLGGVILSPAEFAWLSNAWRRATGGELSDACCPALMLKRFLH